MVGLVVLGVRMLVIVCTTVGVGVGVIVVHALAELNARSKVAKREREAITQLDVWKKWGDVGPIGRRLFGNTTYKLVPRTTAERGKPTAEQVICSEDLSMDSVRVHDRICSGCCRCARGITCQH